MNNECKKYTTYVILLLLLFLLLFIHPLMKCVVIRKTKNLPGKVNQDERSALYIWVRVGGEAYETNGRSGFK